MKAIVFGGSGFLGSHVADALAQRGFEVAVYDRVRSPYPGKNQTMIVGDILEAAKVKKFVAGCDYVYNFAGIADIAEAGKDPVRTIEANIVGNANILEACRQAKVGRFVFASSVYVYSDLAPFYRSSKQACELIIEDYARAFGLDYTILRYGSLYGPRANDSNFIRKILRQAVAEGKISRAGDGEEIRDYIHVLDAAKCSVDILVEEFKNQHVLLTGTQSTKVTELFTMIKEMLQGRIEIEYLPGKNSDHYEITPYAFRPRVAKKFVSQSYHDLGQGILDVLYEIHAESDAKSKELGEVKRLLETGIQE